MQANTLRSFESKFTVKRELVTEKRNKSPKPFKYEMLRTHNSVKSLKQATLERLDTI
jgi:hypothetical protein